MQNVIEKEIDGEVKDTIQQTFVKNYVHFML